LGIIGHLDIHLFTADYINQIGALLAASELHWFVVSLSLGISQSKGGPQAEQSWQSSGTRSVHVVVTNAVFG
jgi:hypothetical protein